MKPLWVSGIIKSYFEEAVPKFQLLERQALLVQLP
jgi:hypothetical protein